MRANRAQEAKAMWELLRLFHNLGDIGWNPVQHWATFPTLAAAIQFKRTASDWGVQYLEEEG